MEELKDEGEIDVTIGETFGSIIYKQL